MNHRVLVQPDKGGWTLTVVTIHSADRQPDRRVLGHYPNKRRALAEGRGAYKALDCEMQVANKRGRWTTEGSGPRR